MIDDLRQGGHLDLDEWRPRWVLLRPSQASALARVAGKQLEVQVTEEAGVFRLNPTSYVGSISVAELHLSIHPKVGIHNLLMMLDIDFSTDIWKPEDSTYTSENDLLAAMAAFYARTLQRTLAQGLLRSYREERDRLPALRGRIDFAEMIRQPGLPIPIPSVFSEHTADVFPNRILKQATRVLTRTAGVPTDAMRRLHRSLVGFEEVTDTREDPDEVDRFTFDRLTTRYSPAMKLAAVVLRNLTLRTEAGGTTSSAFLVNMNDLYQDFLLNRLRRALAGRLSVDGEPPTPLDVGKKVVMNPDYLFTRDDVPAYVGDAKYKIASGPGFAGSGDHYQMLAYCTALDLREGVLIYCTSDGDQTPVDVTVRTSGHVIRTYHLPLTGSPSQVEAAIGDLANWIVQRSDVLAIDRGITRSAVA